MGDYAHVPVTDDPIVVDFSGCKYLDDLYERIQKSFGFPACCHLLIIVLFLRPDDFLPFCKVGEPCAQSSMGERNGRTE